MNLFLAFFAVANAASTFKVNYRNKSFRIMCKVLAFFRLPGIDFYFWPFTIFNENHFQGRSEDGPEEILPEEQEFLCSVAAYYNLAKENSDYPKLPSDVEDFCDWKDGVGSNCKCSDPENFDFDSKKNCDYITAGFEDMPADEKLNAGQECYMALVCDTEYPEGCGFLTNALSFGLIIFCTLLKL